MTNESDGKIREIVHLPDTGQKRFTPLVLPIQSCLVPLDTLHIELFRQLFANHNQSIHRRL